MKAIRYTLIVILVSCLAVSFKAFLTPEISFTLQDGAELNAADINSEMRAEAVAKYRVIFLPWLVMIGLILCGWIFLSRKKVVYGTVVASVGIFGYILFSSIRGQGYTMSQFISAALQGHGIPMFGWNWFYLIALIALPIATMKFAQIRSTTESSEHL